MRLLYFARIREKAGTGEEEVFPPEAVTDVASLVDWLKARGGRAGAALDDLRSVRVAVNQQHVGFDHPVGSGDEVAFFPPVTGGRHS